MPIYTEWSKVAFLNNARWKANMNIHMISIWQNQILLSLVTIYLRIKFIV